MKPQLLKLMRALYFLAFVSGAATLLQHCRKKEAAPTALTDDFSGLTSLPLNILVDDYPHVKWRVKGMHEGKEIELYATEIAWLGEKHPDVIYRPDIIVTEATVATSLTGIKTYVIKAPYDILPIEWLLPDMKHSN